MKYGRRFELNRIFSVASWVLLSIIIYMIANLILTKNIRQDIEANSAIESTKTTIDIGRNSSGTIDQNLILKRNIFNPQKTEPVPKDIQPKIQPPKTVAKKQIELRLLGTVAGSKDVACAIIEDMKTKVQDIYRTGDVIEGALIERIERNRIVLLNDGAEEILNLYVAGNEPVYMAKQTGEGPAAIAEPNVPEKAAAESEINKKAFLAKIGGIEAVLKTVKISPHTVDGKTDGLKITGLEELSMARFVGLENGDVIQTINGQSLTDSRKAFQVLQKARALSSMDIMLTRGTQKKTLSFKIE